MIEIAGNYTAEAILFDDDLHFIKDHFTQDDFAKDHFVKNQTFEEHQELAEAYVPIQKMDKIYSPDKALLKGTVFPELYRPYQKCECGAKESSKPPKLFWEVDVL